MQEDGRSLNHSNVSMKDESELPRTRANNHPTQDPVPKVKTNGFRENTNQQKEEHWLEGDKEPKNVQSNATNQKRQNGKRRGAKASNNKVAPVSFVENSQGKKNYNTNNNNSNVVEDDESVLYDILEGDMSDNSEGYNSTRESESQFLANGKKEHDDDGPQRVNGAHKTQRKVKPLKSRNSKSSILSCESRVSSR